MESTDMHSKGDGMAENEFPSRKEFENFVAEAAVLFGRFQGAPPTGYSKAGTWQPYYEAKMKLAGVYGKLLTSLLEARAECTDLADQRTWWADEASIQRHESNHWRRLYHEALEGMEGWHMCGLKSLQEQVKVATEQRDEARAECTELSDQLEKACTCGVCDCHEQNVDLQNRLAARDLQTKLLEEQVRLWKDSEEKAHWENRTLKRYNVDLANQVVELESLLRQSESNNAELMKWEVCTKKRVEAASRNIERQASLLRDAVVDDGIPF